MRSIVAIFFLLITAFSFCQEGEIKASDYGILSNGKIYSAKINSLLSLPDVTGIIFGEGNIMITNNVIGRGKNLTFINSKLVSLTKDTVFNAYVVADPRNEIFDSSVTVVNLLNAERSVRWFGAKEGIDSWYAFDKAMNAGSGPKVYVPHGDYSLSKTLDVKGEFYGDGQFTTIIRGNGYELFLKTVAWGTRIHDLYLWGGQGGGVSRKINSDIAHGIWINSPFTSVDRVAVRSFDGHGISISGDINSIPRTNANFATVSNVWLYGNGNANIYSQGGDGSGALLININSEAGGRWGMLLAEFLGQTVINPGLSSNVIDHNFQKTLITHKGKQYWAYDDSKGVEPDSSSSYWVEQIPRLYSPSIKPWDSTEQYFSGGSYYISDGNATSTVIGGYLEGDQLRFRNNGRSVVIGGTAADFGSFGGAIGNRNGWLTSVNWQALNRTTGIAVQMNSVGNFLGWTNTGNGASIGFHSNIQSISVAINNSDNRGIYFFNPADWVNLAGKLNNARPQLALRDGYFSGIDNRIDRVINRRFGTAPPPDCTNKGDIIDNVDIGTNGILLWQCDGSKWIAYKAVKN